ncbi:MAG: KTSC domain-containing protein [Alphaproteobacteria bacterium]|nr:KTSC domain-containing protein [Alphaproteobacteria bacterium]
MPVVDSDALSFVRYDARSRTLFATFRGRQRRSYIYEDVTPQEYKDLMAAESKGAWFNAHIRDSHPFREV